MMDVVLPVELGDMRWTMLRAAIVVLATAVVLPAQEPELAKEIAPAASPEEIQRWIRDLDSERYQAREDATAALLRAGYEAVRPVADAAETGGLEVAIRAVFVLREAALSEDTKTAEAAEKALEGLSQTRSVAAPRAAGALQALAELRRRRIRAHLASLGAKFQSTQRFLGVDPYPDYFGLWLDQDWKGTDEDLVKLKFLTHITTVTVDGPQVNDVWLRHIAEMPNLISVSVKRAKISDDGLTQLKQIPKLQELNIYYSPIGDGAVEHLTALRGLTVLKLYGGGFTRQGEAAIKRAFENTATELDMRKGAFLGVSCNPHPAGCMVSYVREGSAAAKAGLQPGDVIVRYDAKKVDDFEGLTALIAEHMPGETSELEILRGTVTLKKKVTLGQWE